jgi:hypothetical protein
MRYRQHRLEWWRQRARRLLRRIFTRSYVKRQRVYRVELGAATLKRLVVADSRRAEVLATNLRSFAHSPAVPGLVSRFENEVWVEFLEGRALEADDPHVPAALARMFATLSAEKPRQCDARELGLDREVRGDLRLLERAGVLAPARCDQLVELAEESLPEMVWIGHDYSDPRPQNFLWDERGELCVIDVESIVRDRLIGRGAAKALVRWLAPRRAEFLRELAKQPGPNFLPYMGFVELQFLASWQKRSLLQRKLRLVDGALFDRFGDSAEAVPR